MHYPTALLTLSYTLGLTTASHFSLDTRQDRPQHNSSCMIQNVQYLPCGSTLNPANLGPAVFEEPSSGSGELSLDDIEAELELEQLRSDLQDQTNDVYLNGADSIRNAAGVSYKTKRNLVLSLLEKRQTGEEEIKDEPMLCCNPDKEVGNKCLKTETGMDYCLSEAGDFTLASGAEGNVKDYPELLEGSSSDSSSTTAHRGAIAVVLALGAVVTAMW